MHMFGNGQYFCAKGTHERRDAIGGHFKIRRLMAISKFKQQRALIQS